MTAMKRHLDDKKKQDGGAFSVRYASQSSAAAMAAVNKSMADMQEAMRRLTERMSLESNRELLAAAFSSWPMPLQITMQYNEPPVYVDTGAFKFKMKDLMEIWGHLSVPGWVEHHFNEVEQADSDSLFSHINTLDPSSEMTIDVFMEMITKYFDSQYPVPLARPFTSFNGFTMEQKDYFLPGLKVLNLDSDGVFWSPVYAVPWTDNELSADHHPHPAQPQLLGSQYHPDIRSTMGVCNCGIYASVNLTELRSYFMMEDAYARNHGMDTRFTRRDRKLCIIEPSSEAIVWQARKGWKSDKAFISEVVGETISIPDAAELLSMVWQRRLDLSTLFSQE